MMKRIELKNSKLSDYFDNYTTSNDLSDWEEFHKKSFFTERNDDTNKLIDQFEYLLPDIVDQISDNVMIFSSLNEHFEEIISKGYLIVDRAAYNFLNEQYDISYELSNISYIDDIDNGKKLELIIDDCRKSSKPYLLAIGGGRTMDYAKFISLKSGVKLLAIPSSLATHVYASPKIHALEPIKDLGYKMTIDGNPAHLSFIDINVLSSLLINNQRLVFSGFGDIMAFINARYDWINSAKKGNERYSLFVDKSIDSVINILKNIDLTLPLSKWISEYIFIQCLLCHITDWVGSAPASGAEHLFAKCIEDDLTDAPLHGEVVALGVLIFCYIRDKDIELTKLLLKKFNISVVFQELGINKESIIKALMHSSNEGLKKKRYTILQDIDNSYDNFEAIVNKMINGKFLKEFSS